MSLKSEIKKAINIHSKKFNAKRVWGITPQENLAGEVTLWIEVSATKKKARTARRKVSEKGQNTKP